MKSNRIRCALGIVSLLCNSSIAQTQDHSLPYAENDYPDKVYWGDTHVHTNLSTDAYEGGNRLSPNDSYRFARGEKVRSSSGQVAQLKRPLDFLVVADHAENMGVRIAMDAKDKVLLKNSEGKRWYERYKQVDRENSPEDAQALKWELYWDLKVADLGEAFKRSVWSQVIDNAERNNIPNQFTAFLGYEWSLSVGDTKSKAHLHRVVVYKDGAEKASRTLPFSTNDGDTPEQLWAYLDLYQKTTGGEALAIPHNPNLSQGKMFLPKTTAGQPYTWEDAEIRSRWEPLLEVTQIKGDSETHPVLSPNDQFADYERWNGLGYFKQVRPGDGDRKQYEYGRSALKQGLQQQAKLGVNPFKFGMIGSTDAHTSLPAIEERYYWGAGKEVELKQDRMDHWRFSASGYAGVWAEENTRESLFSAMKRKEVYATTGPRITVRFFGGWDYQVDDAFKPDLARIGYQKGVPMGGDLSLSPKGKSPNFLIRAVKDPDGANLDRVQVIKGWHDSHGQLHEKIYNVALSDSRKEGRDGSAPSVGSTVNIENASYINSIGDPELSVVWNDPDFNKDELAFYYLRVLEIPTPRWTAYDAKYFGLKNVPEEVPMVIQERAYTSPIWYSP